VKLLYFADTRFPIERANGVQTMATCHALAARGHDVTLVVRPDTTTPARDPFVFYDLPPVSGLHVHYVTTATGARTRRICFLLAAMKIVASQPDALVYTRDLGLASFLLQIPSARRPRVIYESHGVSVTVSEEMPRLLGNPGLKTSHRKRLRLNRQERRVWRRAPAYVTITHALEGELTKRYGRRVNVFVVPDGAREADRAAPMPPHLPPSPDGMPIAAYAGHLYPWKGVDVFVRALAITRGLRGLIVGGHPGEADRERVEGLARELGVMSRLEITGLVPPGDVERHLRSATMLVLPNSMSAISDRYTSPLKLFEYMRLGRPIIASNLAAIREVLTDGKTALLVAPDDPEALAAALVRVGSDLGLAAALGAAARGLAPEYTWARRAERLEAALEIASL
jgi:glycosyltransferase involved in cell wall biosynthesis